VDRPFLPIGLDILGRYTLKKSGRRRREGIRTGVIITCMIIFLIGLIPSAVAVPVDIEYYYLKDCTDCNHIKPLITGMECNIGDSIAVMYIDVCTPDGLDRFRRHGFYEVPAVVVNGTIKIPKEKITEENIRAAIERVLLETDMGETPSDVDWDVPLAYSFGLFSGFSPCLMAILGFILTYVTGSGKGLRNSILNSLTFGLGLVVAYIVMGSCVLLVGMSFGGFGPYFTIVGGGDHDTCWGKPDRVVKNSY